MNSTSLPPTKPGPRQPGKVIALCLSGGGFRATFFHLGVLRFLRDSGDLDRVKHVFSVSGGSILAAHCALNWESYTAADAGRFQEAASRLIQFGRADVRGRVVRLWLLSLFTRHLSGLLQAAYETLYTGQILSDLGRYSNVVFHILSTSMATGRVCEFTAEGFATDDGQTVKTYGGSTLPVALAVAASSAFPPFFPPLPLARSMIAATEADVPYKYQYLTDGGVFDNVGLWRARRLRQLSGGIDEIIVSDASAPFDWRTDSSFGLLSTRTSRVVDVLMNRVATLEYAAGGAADERVLHISDVAKSAPRSLNEDVQRRVKHIRTDLDAFAEYEITALIQHGYEVAQDRLGPTGIHVPWDPLGPGSRLEPAVWARRLEASERRKLGRGPWTGIALLVVLFVLLASTVALWRVRSFRKACADAGTDWKLGLVCFDGGPGVEKNVDRAEKLFRWACDCGVAGACRSLAYVLDRGSVGAANPTEGARFSAKACDGGDMNGCVGLAVHYENGNGVKKDPGRARNLYAKACNGGSMQGCFDLGRLTKNGTGGEENVPKAVDLYLRACEGGVALACRVLANAYDEGEKSVGGPDARQGLYFAAKACDGEDMKGCVALAVHYENGLGVRKDLSKAMEFYKKACEGRERSGCEQVARLGGQP